MKKITFITTGQPATNPRLVKEAELLKGQGYDVKVICCFYQAWALEADLELTEKYPGMYIYCGGDPVVRKVAYLKTRIRQKLCTWLFNYTRTRGVPENAIGRCHTEALNIAKKIKTDLYIAHNLGALPAAVMAARNTGAKVGYDAEDMDSGQFTSKRDKGYWLNKYIEEEYFGQLDYFTAASPLIAHYYQQEYNDLKPVVINNVFPRTSLKIVQNYTPGRTLKLFWFSQTIGAGRGLEQVLEAMALSKGNIALHLLGHARMDDKESLADLAARLGLQPDQLQFHLPVAPEDIFKFSTRFDIGMATETGEPINRDICLTNKIFTYLQSGLAIIASDTQAQSLFMARYPGTGKLYDKMQTSALADCLNFYLQNPEVLYRTRLHNYQLGQTELNWEQESGLFLNLIRDL